MPTYVHCLTGSAHPLRLHGGPVAGGPAPALRTLETNGLIAVVSNAPRPLRPKPRDLERHAAVVANLFAAGTVLPIRFGTVSRDDATVLSRLRAGAREFAEALKRLDGAAEFNVKGGHREEAILRDLLLLGRELSERREALRAAGGGNQFARVNFGKQLAAAVAERATTDRWRVVSRLAPHAVEVRSAPPVAGCFVNASFLVTQARRAGFDDALRELRQEAAGYADLRMRGPLPPYSFV